MKTQYKIRKVERFIVTKYVEDSQGNGTSSVVGQYDNEEAAYQVGYALCKAEHDKAGAPLDSMDFIYPTMPSTGFAQPHN